MAQRKRNETVEEFWRRTEEDLGESVRIYAMSRCLSGCVPGSQPMWGLCFLTDRAFYFRHFPQTNWFRALTERLVNPGESDEEVYLSVPLERMESVTVHRETSLLRRIFFYSPPVLELRYRSQRDGEAVMQLVIESKLEKFVEAMRGDISF